MMVYSEYERRLVARTEYTDYDVDATVTIGKQETYKEIGTVREVVTDDFGQKAYVIQSEDKKEVSVIYRGSEGPGTPGSAVDCLDNDFIITSLHVKINI
ncbi:hypothetical protein MX022_07510 [Streptococcus uberis]|uniref:hypothetical protein n=1 Tax=Streptococcus uberis TaxID=1349 RepID=UPI0018E1520A|nr:hypothetical protein [Streptococcus uberis]MCK1162237.1 hypothetical protein [Streptococcus uberis]MCK1165906.1 hypothetical protein [Streptococcus uberis]MCK1195310.1 hypothetical protein [Streptococcus uberis]MCK1198789.1 hypothetical protein [Streptococcus uberis]MCK1232049.1 hypothetical protein [Streptococcus uberis]